VWRLDVHPAQISHIIFDIFGYFVFQGVNRHILGCWQWWPWLWL